MQWLCWLLGTSVLKIDDVALDLLVFLGAVVFTDEVYSTSNDVHARRAIRPSGIEARNTARGNW